jgi:hypothetical protein
LNSASQNTRDASFHGAADAQQLRSLGSKTGRGIMKFTPTSWLLSFALAVLLFSIVSIALFDRMHASL